MTSRAAGGTEIDRMPIQGILSHDVDRDEREGTDKGSLFGLAHRMAEGVADERLPELDQGEKSTAEGPQACLLIPSGLSL